MAEPIQFKHLFWGKQEDAEVCVIGGGREYTKISIRIFGSKINVYYQGRIGTKCHFDKQGNWVPEDPNYAIDYYISLPPKQFIDFTESEIEKIIMDGIMSYEYRGNVGRTRNFHFRKHAPE